MAIGGHIPSDHLDRQRAAQWHVLWTRSHCEYLVHDRLTAKGLHLWLPEIGIWARRGGFRHRRQVPMFPGYVFLHQAMDKATYMQVCKTSGIVRPLGDGWDRLAVIPYREIEVIQTMLRAHLPTRPHPYLREGQRVRITRGPLADIEGILVSSRSKKGLLVVSIDLLRRSVAVEVDCTIVAPA
ncbi:MAG: transcription termination/antitermination protein NusG [bacterium]